MGEFAAIGDTFGSISWDLQVQEYQGELSAPVLPNMPLMSQAPQPPGGQQLAIIVPPQSTDFVTDEQWVRVNKMVAWLSNYVFMY